MSVIGELLAGTHRSTRSFTKGSLPMPPARQVAVVACMDARLNPYGLFGLTEGDAHIIRNAGGVITDAVVRSLAVSQRLLGTRAVILVHHTDCGMLTFTDDAFKAQIEAETGIRPPWAAEAKTWHKMFVSRLLESRPAPLSHTKTQSRVRLRSGRRDPD